MDGDGRETGEVLTPSIRFQSLKKRSPSTLRQRTRSFYLAESRERLHGGSDRRGSAGVAQVRRKPDGRAVFVTERLGGFAVGCGKALAGRFDIGLEIDDTSHVYEYEGFLDEPGRAGNT